MNKRARWQLLALTTFLAASGCSNSGLVEVSGKLTYKGEPVPSTDVIFQPDDGKRASRCITDDDGHFTLRYSRQDSGVMIGRHTVWLAYHRSNDEELGKVQSSVSKEVLSIIANKYGDVKTSPLHYEITKSRSIPIDLE